jgi:hypothetical protein
MAAVGKRWNLETRGDREVIPVQTFEKYEKVVLRK